MDNQRVKRLRRYLTLHFSVISFITAILVSNNGTGDVFLPTLILLVATSGFILVDLLEVFHLGQLGSYLGMAIATIVALVSLGISAFQRGGESAELMSVASLLIYPQCVLFFQKKSLRVFEQLAIFLLLQMIVAALINDNLLYGVLLTPMLLAWVSSLVLFARYATLVQLFPNIEEPVPLLYELIYAKFFKPAKSSKSSNSAVSTLSNMDDSVTDLKWRSRWLMCIPLGVSSLIFAGAMFYFFPRTGESTNLASLSFDRSGVPDRISTVFFGRLIMDPSPVFRLRVLKDGKPIKPAEPPYLRVEVFDYYRAPNRERAPGWWFRSQSFTVNAKNGPKDNPQFSNRDNVRIEIKAKENSSRIGSRLLVSVPPIVGQVPDFNYDRGLMIFEQIGEDHPFSTRKTLQYQYLSAAYSNSQQLMVQPEDKPRNLRELRSMEPAQLPGTDQIRQRILRDSGLDNGASPFQVAKALETHLKSSGEYTYSLNVPAIVETSIDPIDDFVTNTKRGICQHYAGAMVAMLRQSSIPSRIVVGYRPNEWNKMGLFFQVRNSDAHAWVEALFKRDDLIGTEHEPWLTDDEYHWVQFDPTPASDDQDSQILAQNNPLDYAEDLWEDYLTNSNGRSMTNTYAPMAAASQDSAMRLADELNRLKIVIIDDWFMNLGFAWQVTLTIFLLGGIPILIWQAVRWLPRIAPNLAMRMGLIRRGVTIKQAFYARCIGLLESLRIRRPESETLREFSDRACEKLQASDAAIPGVHKSLDALAELYHRLRFGKASELDQHEEAAIDDHLRTVELAVKSAKNRR